MEHNRILCLSPHADDSDIWAGGSIARWIEEGKNVHYVAFSIPPDDIEHKPLVLRKELLEATEVLGIKRENIHISNFVPREFPNSRQDILDYMLFLKQDVKPDLVLLPSTNDTHQDHKVISEEGFRAFKLCSIVGYESPYNNMQFKTGMYVKLSKKHIERKIAAVKKYKSQEDKIYANEGFFKSLAQVRGAQIGAEFAECFEVIRVIE